LSGASLFGVLPGGETVWLGYVNAADTSAAAEFKSSPSECWHSNAELLQSLREDDNSHALHELAMEDFRLGRMSEPVHASSIDWSSVRLVPRFGVEQGLKPDGSAKIRAVDHMSWSASHGQKRKRTRAQVKEESINGHTVVPEKVSHDHLDKLLLLLRLVFMLSGVVPWLWKADVDSAFRRVPLDGSPALLQLFCPKHVRFVLSGAHVWASGVAYMVDNVAWCAFHYGMPFGATSSVWSWHRVGAMIAHFARRILHIAVLRYVDDYFSAERKELVEHAMQCFARLTRILLGPTSIADRKLDYGSSLLVLGMTIEPAHSGIRFVLSAEKAQKYCDVINNALRTGYLSSGMSFMSCQFGVHTVHVHVQASQSSLRENLCLRLSISSTKSGGHSSSPSMRRRLQGDLSQSVSLLLFVAFLFLSGMGLSVPGCVTPFSGGLEFSGSRYRRRANGSMSTTELVTFLLTRHRHQQGVRPCSSTVVE